MMIAGMRMIARLFRSIYECTNCIPHLKTIVKQISFNHIDKFDTIPLSWRWKLSTWTWMEIVPYRCFTVEQKVDIV